MSKGGTFQTRKRRVGPQLEFWRGLGRLMVGQTFTFGEDHAGYYSNGQHALLNWSPVLWLSFLIWLMTVDLSLAKWWVLGSLAIGALLLVDWIYRRIRGWWQFRGLLLPLSRTVGDLCGWPRHVHPWLWLHFPLNWQKSPDATCRVEFKYDAANDEEKQKKILQALESGLKRKLDPRYTEWYTGVRQSVIPFTVKWPYLLLRPECPPPDEAMFADNLKRIEKYKKDSEIPLGIGCYDRDEVVDIDNDAPHAVIAADSGRGKSTVEALVGSVLAHKGAVDVIIDPKIISLQAFKGLPNVAYFGGEEASHHGLLALKAEMKRRALLLDVPWGTEPPDVGPRLMVLIEEADSLVAELRDWKEDIGEGRSNVRSITAMNRLRNMGRELKIHIFIVTQTAGAAALGGAGSQTGFGLQLISANHEGIFKKLAPQVKEIPEQSPHRGRWHVNKPGSGKFPIEVQCFGFAKPKPGQEHLKFAEAREYAVSGKIGVIPELIQEALDEVAKRKETPVSAKVSSLDTKINGGDTGRQGVSVTPLRDTGRHLSVVPDGPPVSLNERIAQGYYDDAPASVLMTLAEAMTEHVLPFTDKEAAKTASRRPGFPYEADERRQTSYGPAKQWPKADLADWARMTPAERIARWPARERASHG